MEDCILLNLYNFVSVSISIYSDLFYNILNSNVTGFLVDPGLSIFHMLVWRGGYRVGYRVGHLVGYRVGHLVEYLIFERR